MITSTIGKIFLEAYNEKYGTSYDAKGFFLEVYHPLFFNHHKYMMSAGNNPLENPKISWEPMLKGQKPYETPEQRKVRLDKLQEKISIGKPTTENAIGFASEDMSSTTSGQTSNIDYPFSEEEIYNSWIGASLGIGIQGGLSILFSDKHILMDIFDGWTLYRDALESTTLLKGNQVNSWNGQWLSHRYSRLFVPTKPMSGFAPFETDKNGIMSVTTQSWTKLLIGTSRHFNDPQMLGYVYSLGQTNTTIGFIPFNLSQIRKPIQFYVNLFGMENSNAAEKLWGTQYGFRTACKTCVIGLKAMEPKGLTQYIKGEKLPRKAKDEEQQLTYNTYIIWILAMLNNQELWSKSNEFAQVLSAFTKAGKKSTTSNSQKVTTILSATNKKAFIAALTEIVASCDQKEKIVELAELVNSMPSDNVPYFLTLLRFSYTSIA